MLIRPVKKEDMEVVAKIHVDTRRKTYEGVIPNDTLSRRTYERQKDKWINNLYYNDDVECIMYVAENEFGEIVGFAAADINTVKNIYGSQLTSIFVLPEFQKQEIGKKLVKTLANAIHEKGIKNMLLWIVEDAPTRGFYDSLGGKVAFSRLVYMSSQEIREVAYVFDDITRLL